MYWNNRISNWERLRSNSRATPEQLHMKTKPTRKSQSWICSVCSLNAKRHWNIQRHIERQYYGSYAVPLDAVTRETRDEKYRKHAAEKNMLSQYVSNFSSSSPPTLNNRLLDHIRNNPLTWPWISFRDSYYLDGLEILQPIAELFDSTTSIQQRISNSSWSAAAGAANYRRKLIAMAQIMNPPFASPQSIISCQSLSQHQMNIARGNYNFSALRGTDNLKYHEFSPLDTRSNNDKLILGYQLYTCRRCHTTDCFAINFQYDGAKCMNSSVRLLHKGSLCRLKNHVCNEKYFRNEICGLSPQKIEEFKNCVELEKNSGQFLFKAISSGPWIEKPKYMIALKVPPRIPDDARNHVSINSQISPAVTNTISSNSIGYQQYSSYPIPISARINLLEILMIATANCHTPIFNAALEEGVIKLDDKELIKFCESVKESSIVLASRNIGEQSSNIDKETCK
jgi:hypothetical protein